MKTLLAIAALVFAGCGDVTTDVDQGGGGESVNPGSGACYTCLGNEGDGLTDEECLARYGLTLVDC